ncbi:MAG: UvrD-helicase domain-containing protein [Flavobacteriales bacterium]
MPLTTSKALQVYAASAGSGKTHRLVLEYLKILLDDPAYRTKFRSIVAMTFTNKAANEMKERILQTLSGLAYPHQADRKAKALAKGLLEETSLTETQLQQRALGALQGILHHYEDFNISTIDKFNLRLIRSFSRDLDIAADFEVVMNEKLIMEEVVDLMISQLGQPDSVELSDWMLSYARTKISEGESWDFKKSLLQFAEILSKERNVKEVDQLLQTSYSKEKYQQIKDAAAQVKTEFLALCKSVYTPLAPYISTHFKNKTDIKRFEALNTDPNWCLGKKTGPFYSPTMLTALQENKWNLPDNINAALIDLSTAYETATAAHAVLEVRRKNFFNLALLQYVAQQTKDLMAAQQQIRISEFNQLISQLVRGEQAPYIYERLGIRYEHFLLDEFQDTSRLQWINLIPLVLEAISYERPNLIVGDAKQSIYRFNNGLAEQFVALPSLYNPEGDAHMAQMSQRFEISGQKKSLDDNYRSAEQIVEFNNVLFAALAKSLPTDQAPFYADLRQTPQANKSGYIRIESLVNDLPTELLHGKILASIEAVLQDQFRPCDICILTETNKQGNDLAIALNNAGHQVVSQDSLLIYNHPAVQIFLLYLKKRARPSNPTLGKRFAEAYLQFMGNFDVAKYLSYFEQVEKDGKKYRFFNENKFYNDHFGSEAALFMPFEHLYDLLQKVALVLSLDDTQDPYLHHFFDIAFQYQLNRNAELLPFLEYMEQSKDKLALQMPESTEAIRIMTIHKAKGLEFPVVLIPSLDFSIDIRSYSKFLIPVGPDLTYSYPSATIPEYKAFKEKELAAIFLDKLNLLYVALTRPELRLYIFNHHKKNGFGARLHAALESLPLTWPEEHVLTIGEPQKGQTPDTDETTLFYHPVSLKDQLWYPSLAFRQHGLEVAAKDQLFGLAFHRTMALCTGPDHLELAINEALDEGSIAKDQVTDIRIGAQNFWTHVQAHQLFEGVVEQYNEQRIIAGINELRQPDKVWLKANEVLVIDFKTGKRKDKDLEQISAYAQLLGQIFNLPVRSFIYYVQLDLFLDL